MGPVSSHQPSAPTDGVSVGRTGQLLVGLGARKDVHGRCWQIPLYHLFQERLASLPWETDRDGRAGLRAALSLSRLFLGGIAQAVVSRDGEGMISGAAGMAEVNCDGGTRMKRREEKNRSR